MKAYYRINMGMELDLEYTGEFYKLNKMYCPKCGQQGSIIEDQIDHDYENSYNMICQSCNNIFTYSNFGKLVEFKELK